MIHVVNSTTIVPSLFASSAFFTHFAYEFSLFSPKYPDDASSTSLSFSYAHLSSHSIPHGPSSKLNFLSSYLL